MPSIIDSLVVLLTLDASGWQKGENDARSAEKKTREQALKGGKEIEANAKRQREAFNALKTEAVGALAVLFGAKSLKEFFVNTVTTDAAVGRLAKTLGVTTEVLSAWQGVVRQMGGTSEDASAGLQTLVDLFTDFRLGQMDPRKAGILNRLGITPEDLKDPTTAALKLAAAFHKLDPRVASEYGKQLGLTPAFINTLIQGREKVEDLYKAQEALGTIHQKDAEAAQEFQKRLEGLKTSAGNLGRALVTDLLPPLSGLLEGWTYMLTHPIGDTLDQAAEGLYRIFHHGEGWNDVPGGGGGGARPAPAAGGGGSAGHAPNDPSVSSGNVNVDNTVRFFKDRGWTDAQARGMAAGLYSESHLDPKAFNKAGGGQGAFGIGQWRGKRLKRLFEMFGPNPTLFQQLEYVQWELDHGETGARDIIRQRSTPQTAASAFISRYERPGGKGYIDDMNRANRILGINGGGSSTSVTVGNITIVTQATDAKGIAAGITPALKAAVPQANIGLR